MRRSQELVEALLALPAYRMLREDALAFGGEQLFIHSPLYLPDIEKAAAWLREAQEGGWPTLIVGDRDVDGVCSTAMIAAFLREHSPEPERVALMVSDDGDDYGLSGAFFDQVMASPARLVVLLDMGTSNGPEIAALASAGKRIIVLDHHQLHDRIADPLHCAFVNPMRLTQPVFEHNNKIATVALAFKLLLACALSHTRDWRRFCYLETPEGCMVYRLGAYLGLAPSLEAARERLDKAAEGEWTSLYGDDLCDPATMEIFQQRPLEAGRRLLAALIQTRPRLRAFAQRHSDLAALGLLTDIAPLVGENRTLVRVGSRVAQRGQANNSGSGAGVFRPGLRALLDRLDLPERDVLFSRDIAWSVGPTLNAAGRMGNTRLALDLLMEEDVAQAARLAQQLIALNEERKRRTGRNQEIADQWLSSHPECIGPGLLFCYHPDLKPGVSGIVAARLSERYDRTAVYVNLDGERAKGSVRSTPGVDAVKLLEYAADLLIQYGGHPEAAGFSLAPDRIAELQKRLLSLPQERYAAPEFAATPGDALVAISVRPGEISEELYRLLSELEPFGPGNPAPMLHLRNVTPAQIKPMKNGLHLRFQVQGMNPRIDAVAWRLGPKIQQLLDASSSIDLVGALELSAFAGRRRLQFRVEEVQSAAALSGSGVLDDGSVL
ncbi:MAG: DHH family phosphoesterase [Leptospirales bacterium]|nr:DHH family phosphoesterase [Leptospirales bacterium]